MGVQARFAAVGLFGGSAGTLLLPDAAEDDAAALSEGRLEGLGPHAAFMASIARQEDPGTAIDGTNRALLYSDIDGVAASAASARGTGDLQLAAFLEAVAYRLGADLELVEIEDTWDPRVQAYLLATRAHERAAEGDEAAGVRTLCEASRLVASASPVAAARLLGEAASLTEGVADTVATLLLELDRAVERIHGTDFEELRGELLMARGGLLMELGSQRPALLQEAVQCFQRATQALPRRSYPVPYAVCHLNVAVAYLSMPMGQHAARLRAAIAVQSLREALEVFDPAEHADLWQAATLNLANALQHLPSSHVEENLAEAVSLYEQLLGHRMEAGPARARVLANLGNALAHLGDFKGARPRLDEARRLFEALGDADAVAGIDAVYAEMEATLAASPAPASSDAPEGTRP